MESNHILEPIMEAIGNAKGMNINVLDVRDMTDVTDYMVIVTGSSNRHVKSIMKTVIQELRVVGRKPIGVEGEQYAQWILLDYSDVILHIMITEAREFYDLERLWQETLKIPTTATGNLSSD